MNYKAITILLGLVLLIMIVKNNIFSEYIITLDESNIETINDFKELPLPVQEVMDKNIAEIAHSNRVLAFCLDSFSQVYYGPAGRGKNWLNEVSNNYYHLFVDGIHYRLTGNNGPVFILYNGAVYTGELNILEDDYKQKRYFRIELEN